MSSSDLNTIAFAEAAWDAAVAEVGPIGVDGRRAWLKLVDRFRRMGMSPEHAGAALAQLVADHKGSFEAGMTAFQALLDTIERFEAVLEKRADPRTVVEGMLAARAAMADIHYYLATIAGRADVSGVSSTKETAALAKEAKADLARFRGEAP